MTKIRQNDNNLFLLKCVMIIVKGANFICTLVIWDNNNFNPGVMSIVYIYIFKDKENKSPQKHPISVNVSDKNSSKFNSRYIYIFVEINSLSHLKNNNIHTYKYICLINFFKSQFRTESGFRFKTTSITNHNIFVSPVNLPAR